jgi:hypothetical protein
MCHVPHSIFTHGHACGSIPHDIARDTSRPSCTGRRGRILFWHNHKRLPDEDAAVNKARDLIKEQVARAKFGLRGVLDPRQPSADIDPADAEIGVLDIFAGELRVFLHDKLVRTCRQVHCYKTDVDRCVAELHSKTKRGKWTSQAGLEKFAADYKAGLNGAAPPTEAVFTDAANRAGHYRPREEMRRVLRNTFGPRQPGHPTKSAGK